MRKKINDKLKLTRETLAERKSRVSSGVQIRSAVFQNKKKYTRSKKYDSEEI